MTNSGIVVSCNNDKATSLVYTRSPTSTVIAGILSHLIAL